MVIYNIFILVCFHLILNILDIFFNAMLASIAMFIARANKIILNIEQYNQHLPFQMYQWNKMGRSIIV